MDRRSATSAAGDRVYQAIKASVIAYAFPQGRRIYLQPLADALGVSTTPIREALNRLAAENLVIKAPRKGFIAMSLSEENLVGYYELTRLLLARELEGLDAAARRKLPEFEPIAGVLYRLNRRVISDVSTLAGYTGEIFSDIASLGKNSHVVRSICHANDHLFYIRTVECRHVENVQDELRRLCELLLGGRCEGLLRAIHGYHDKRVVVLPTLLDLTRR
ncbi:MAG: GntR family transcriptional regulator [Woeseia sp.]